MDAHPEVMAAQPKVLAWHSKQEYEAGNREAICFEHAGAAGGMMDVLGYPYCRGRMMSHVEEDRGQYDDEISIFWATGACMLTRTRKYKELGGLDARFFAHQEEIDLCWRMYNKTSDEGKIVYLPQSVVYHVGGGTLGYENPRKTFLNFRNNLLMLYKNLPSRHRWWIMWVRFGMDYLAALQMLLTGQKENVKAVVKARRAYHKMKKEYTTTCDNKMKGFQLLARRSIVWDFYVRKKRV
jgi:GT2 family glycosyltransferase